MKGLVKNFLIGFLTAVMTVFWLVGCTKIEKPTNDNTLDAVSESSISATVQGTTLTVEWGSVQQAVSYAVTFGDTTVTVNAPATSAVFNDVAYTSGSITITIVAQAPDYNSSATSCTLTPTVKPVSSQTQLGMPSLLAIRDGELMWTSVANATSYTVSDGSKAVTVATNSVDLAANGLAVPASGNITYTVIAKADGYADSAAAVYTYLPLAKPALVAMRDGELMWTSVANATSYTVSDGTKSVTVYENSIELATSGLTVPKSGSITYSIVAHASGYNDSAAVTYTYTATASDDEPTPAPQTLAMPTGIALNNGVLSWKAVANATSYTVSDGSNTITVKGNSVDLVANGFDIPKSDSITYSIVAHASGYNDSMEAVFTYTPTVNPTPTPQTLAMPTGLAVNSGVLSWKAVANATSYEVSDGTNSVTVTTTSINLASNGLTVPTSGSINYSVVAKATGYDDSAAAVLTYTPPVPQKLAEPIILGLSDGKLTWRAVANATSYVVSDGTNSATVTTTDIDLASKGLAVPTNGTVTYTVIAKASGYYDSDVATYTAAPTLAAPTGLAISDGVLSWTAVENATTYTVTDGSTHVIVSTNSIDLAASGFIIPASGKATYKVVAHASGYADSAEASYTHTYEELREDIVTFGMYPQSLKAANVTIVSSTPDSDGYYAGSDGAKYAKVTATPYLMYSSYKVNFSNGDAVTTGVEYYFKVEPIKWRILGMNGDNTLLFCESIIANGAYYNGEDVREIGGTVYANNYMYSDIRTWLNGDFYRVAFDSAAQQYIQTTTVNNSAETSTNVSNIYACENTADKVFLLSASELTSVTYGFETNPTSIDPARLLTVSDYARATGAYTSDSLVYLGCGWWWTRSPMFDSELHTYGCLVNGMVGSVKVSSAEGGIAPAIWVSTSAL